MNLLVLADDRVGTRICEYLAESFREDLGLVVTVEENALFHSLMAKGIPVASQAVLADTAGLHSHKFDLGILAWWPRILKAELLGVPSRGFINTHPSLLPHNRGKHYSFWAIVEEAPFGVTIHCVDEGIDTGPVLAQKRIPYDWTDTGETLYHMAQEAMVDLFREAYPAIRLNALEPIAQDKLGPGSSHRASEIDAASRLCLENSYPLRYLLNLLRARTFTGRPACSFRDIDGEYDVTIAIRRRE